MDIVIPTFFMAIGIYYIKTYSVGREADSILVAHDKEAAIRKCKRGRIGGYALVLLAVAGYVLAFIKW